MLLYPILEADFIAYFSNDNLSPYIGELYSLQTELTGDESGTVPAEQQHLLHELHALRFMIASNIRIREPQFDPASPEGIALIAAIGDPSIEWNPAFRHFSNRMSYTENLILLAEVDILHDYLTAIERLIWAIHFNDLTDESADLSTFDHRATMKAPISKPLDSYFQFTPESLLIAGIQVTSEQGFPVTSRRIKATAEGEVLPRSTMGDPIHAPAAMIQQLEMNQSFSALLSDFAACHLVCNALTGLAAKTRTLLVDDAIPLPTPETYLGWAAICQTEEYGLINGYRIIGYLQPCLPWTREYSMGSGGSVSDESGHFDHSLPAKSKGHARTASGGIKAGEICYSRFCVEQPGLHEGYTKIRPEQRIPDSILLPKHRTVNTGYFTLPLSNPYALSHQPMVDQQIRTGGYQPDLGLRALAKQYRVHLRFDNPASAAIWRLAFEESARAYLGMSESERLHLRFQSKLKRIADLAAKPAKAVSVTTSTRRATIDLGFLGN